VEKNPTKRAEKVTFVTAKYPTPRAEKQYKKRKNTTTTTTLQQHQQHNNTNTTTRNGTEHDQNPGEFKSNHSS
jgi:hypothetical protein